MSTSTTRMEKECIVTGYFALTLRIAKYIGLAPLRIKKTEKGLRISPSLLWYVVSCIVATIKSLLLMWSSIADVQFYRENQSSPVTRRTAFFLDVSSLTLTCVLMAYASLREMRCIIAVMSELQKIGNMLSICNLTLSWKKKRITIFVIWGIICMAVSLNDFNTMIKCLQFSKLKTQRTTSFWTKASFFIHYTSFIYVQMEVIMFVLLVLHIRSIFKAINQYLRSVLEELEHQQQNKNKINTSQTLKQQSGIRILKKVNNYVDAMQESANNFSGDITKSLPHEKIHHIASAYSLVCQTVRVVDDSFGFKLITILGLYFLRLVTTPYYFINNFVDEESDTIRNIQIFITKEVAQFFWIIYHIVNLAALIEPCHLTYMEVETTRELVSRLMVHAHSVFDPMAVELEQFCRQLILSEVSFRPMNVLTMSRGLLLTVLSSITTYLVILIDIKY